MKKKLSIYMPFINAGMQETTTYRANWIFMMLGNVLGCFVSYFIWNAVFISSGDSNMNGFTMPQMVVYIFLMFLTSTIISSGGTYDIGEEIRDGSIAMRMIKPISYNSTFMFQELGNKFMTCCILIVPMVIGVEIVRTIFIGSVQFNILGFGFIAFIIKYLWGANMMKNCIVGFLSGVTIPLSFLPKTLEQIFLFLPFASLNYTPVMIYMGKYSGASLVYYLGLQVFWVLFFWALSKLLWKVALKHLSVQGG